MSRATVPIVVAVLLAGCFGAASTEPLPSAARRVGGVRTFAPENVFELDGSGSIRLEGDGLVQGVVDFTVATNLSALDVDRQGSDRGVQWLVVVPAASWLGPNDGTLCSGPVPDVTVYSPTLEFQSTGNMDEKYGPGSLVFLMFSRGHSSINLTFGEVENPVAHVFSKPAVDYELLEIPVQANVTTGPSSFVVDFEHRFVAPGPGLLLTKFSVSGGSPDSIYGTAAMRSNVTSGSSLCGNAADMSRSPLENVFRAPVTASIAQGSEVRYVGHFDSGLKRDPSTSRVAVEALFLR